ncbi:hypothetical protein A2129_00845 [Candidatus Woesebacteria bacterium GWC1_42_13]|uniref:Glycosyl transferase family 1 domain-containing protein n=1 Tax=Candidatus Woesebacteria bacterium GWC1_42_13 TaxID=1802475 RepID=A0A1F7WTJ4_9BACT|nr:MAG: hypothetical protein A2129_00845 [Candidatus Woesebacteria bacterium GWC1_42_13]
MKIVIDARMYGIEHTGIGRYVMELTQNLAKIDRKNDYTLILRNNYFKSLSLPANFKKIKGDFRQYSFSEQISLPKILKNEKPDLVHFPHFNVPILYRGDYVVTIHDLLMHKQKGFEATTLAPIVYLIKRLGYRAVFDRAVKKPVKIIVPSHAVKKELVDYYSLDPDKVSVTPEGVSDLSGGGAVTPLLKKYGIETPYFIYTGNAYPHKNLKRLIEAIISLNTERRIKAHLVIVSARNFFVKKLEKLISEMGAGAFVKVLGFLPDEEVGTLYRHSAAFVFPTLSEGFGIPGLDAMEVGTLVLASEILVLKEVYKEHAIYFNPFDFSSIARTMELALEIGAEAREERIAKARDFVKRYSWNKMAQETLKIYESCARIR